MRVSMCTIIFLKPQRYIDFPPCLALFVLHTHTYTRMPSDMHEQELLLHLKPKNKTIERKR